MPSYEETENERAFRNSVIHIIGKWRRIGIRYVDIVAGIYVLFDWRRKPWGEYDPKAFHLEEGYVEDLWREHYAHERFLKLLGDDDDE
jgi:hypothetical protein